jgi:ribonuclease BN (tRNA processing enzyme)
VNVRLIVAGCGTASPDAERVGAAYVVEAGATRILLDCGPGGVHGLARARVEWTALSHVCITHFHNDHIGDLPFLFFAWKYGTRPARAAPITLLGPVGLREFVNSLPEALGAHVREPGFPVHIHEMRDGDLHYVAPDVRLAAHATPHTASSLAYRIDYRSHAIGYTGDTGPSDALGEFFRNTRLLISECSLPDDEAMTSHLSPSAVAHLANIAKPERLLLTHVYPQLDRNTLADAVKAAGWTGETIIARDGLSISL